MISKILVKCLKNVMHKVISLFQGVFIKGEGVHDNIRVSKILIP